MMAKMSHRMRQTNSTLKMLGMAWMSALTTTYTGMKGSFREMDRILKKKRQLDWVSQKESSISTITFELIFLLAFFRGGNRTESKQRNRPCCF
jgi:hypothetical protein